VQRRGFLIGQAVSELTLATSPLSCASPSRRRARRGIALRQHQAPRRQRSVRWRNKRKSGASRQHIAICAASRLAKNWQQTVGGTGGAEAWREGTNGAVVGGTCACVAY